MIAATGLELRAGAQLLLEGATFQISPGDKVGLVGRNGAGKTTLARVLAGDGLPAHRHHRIPAPGLPVRRPDRAGHGPDPVGARA